VELLLDNILLSLSFEFWLLASDDELLLCSTGPIGLAKFYRMNVFFSTSEVKKLDKLFIILDF